MRKLVLDGALHHWFRLGCFAAALAWAGGSGPAGAEGFENTQYAVAYGTPEDGAAEASGLYSASELETLVGPVALYPDDLLAIVLPAATYPLQIVQAARLLEAGLIADVLVTMGVGSVGDHDWVCGAFERAGGE